MPPEDDSERTDRRSGSRRVATEQGLTRLLTRQRSRELRRTEVRVKRQNNKPRGSESLEREREGERVSRGEKASSLLCQRNVLILAGPPTTIRELKDVLLKVGDSVEYTRKEFSHAVKLLFTCLCIRVSLLSGTSWQQDFDQSWSRFCSRSHQRAAQE